jgi:hypothetical protein
MAHPCPYSRDLYWTLKKTHGSCSLDPRCSLVASELLLERRVVEIRLEGGVLIDGWEEELVG